MQQCFLMGGLILLLITNIGAAQSAGNALSLDGTDDYAAPLTPNVSGMNQGTIEFWFAPVSWTSTNSIWNGGNGHPGVNGDWVKIGSHSPTAGNDNLVFGTYAGSWRWSNSGVLPGTGVWSHVAATWSSSGLKIYLDGMSLNTNSYSGGIPTYATELIGVSSWGGFFNGYVDELRVWNYERSAAQINATLLDTLSSVYYSISDSGLIAYYRMDVLEDLGINSDGADDIRDLSVSGNHLDTYGDLVLSQSGAFNITDVETSSIDSPVQYYLNQNYPNPFNPTTTIQYSVAQSSNVVLKVYDILGNEVITLVNEKMDRGVYSVNFSSKGLASGIYFYRLHAGSFVETKKMILMK
jgi:hypothetical protein